MRASIVIASHNEGELLWKTVRSCLETTADLDCEVVVADDASDDGSFEALRAHCGDAARVVRIERREGVSRAKDLAARAARGDVLLFFDAHVKPEPGAVARMIEGVEGWDGDALIAPRVANLDVDAWRCELDGFSYAYTFELEDFLTDWVDKVDLRAAEAPGGRVFYHQPALAGCCFAIARDLYTSLGGFDTGMLTYGFEDTEFGLRAWLTGHSILLDPVPVVGHRFLAGREKSYRIPTAHYLLNKLRMARRNFGRAAWADWLASNTARSNRRDWGAALALFEEGREDLDRERAALHARRRRDEYQFAAEFGLAWPLTLPSSPFPPMDGARRAWDAAGRDDDDGYSIPTTIPMTKKVPDRESEDPTTIPMTKKVPDKGGDRDRP
jgi:GT2 family glycosyltransferase